MSLPYNSDAILLIPCILVDLNVEPTEAMPNPRTIVSGLAPFMPMESLLVRCTSCCIKKLNHSYT